jgi:hypothetical protein
MQTAVILFAVLITLVVLKPVVRAILAFAFAGNVAKQSLARVPDTIHLTGAKADAWIDAIGARRLASELAKRGFEDAGTYSIPELRNMTVELMQQPVERILAVIYEHPEVGQWVELVTRYNDGSSYSVSSGRDTGLKPRPDHKIVNLPGAPPDMMHKRLISGRPEAEAEAFELHELVPAFEAVYAESVAWRKAQGISKEEVVKAATRKVA